jgi:TIR domain
MAVSSRIFISYRREDATAYAGRLYDRLSVDFPAQVFMDIDTLEPGIDFVERIEESVGTADVLVCVIGKGWASAVDRDGRRRLENPEDFVRLEVGSALKRNIRVIPVLVGGAPFPEPEELPDDLAGLRRRNGLMLSDLEWKAGTQHLVDAIRHVLGIAEEPVQNQVVQQVVQEAQSPPDDVVVPAREGPAPLPAAALPLVFGGAVLLAVGLFMRWHGRNDPSSYHSFLQNDFGGAHPHGGALTSLGPIGIVVAAVLGALLARKPATRAMGAGVLLGAGIAGAAKYLYVLRAADDPTTGVTIGLLVAVAGGVLVLVASVIVARATPKTESPRCVAGAVSAVAGAAAMIVATHIAYNGANDKTLSGTEAFDPVATSIAIALMAGLLLRPWRHMELSAALLTLGALDALLWVRYLGVPLLGGSDAGSLGAGGLVGLAGAGLVLLGGYLGLQGSKEYAAAPAAAQP